MGVRVGRSTTSCGRSTCAAGDFVRWSKQVIDLLDQIKNAGDPDLAETARRATDAVRRGIVAYATV